MISLSAKAAAIMVFVFILLALAALLFAGVFTAKSETEKTFAGAHYISLPKGLGGFGISSGRYGPMAAYQSIPSSSPAAAQDAPSDKETRYKGFVEKPRAK